MVVTRGGARQAVNGLYCAGVCGVCSCVVVCWLSLPAEPSPQPSPPPPTHTHARPSAAVNRVIAKGRIN